MNKFLLKDSSGKKSATMTAFVVGFVVVNAKLVFSGMTIGGFELAPFTGTEYAAALGALGSIYVLRRNVGTGILDKNDSQEKEVKDEI